MAMKQKNKKKTAQKQFATDVAGVCVFFFLYRRSISNPIR